MSEIIRKGNVVTVIRGTETKWINEALTNISQSTEEAFVIYKNKGSYNKLRSYVSSLCDRIGLTVHQKLSED